MSLLGSERRRERTKAPETPRTVTSRPVAWRILRQEPVAYAISLATWTGFWVIPVIAGVLLKILLDQVQVQGSTRLIWGVLAALAGIEISRWLLLAVSAWQWHGVWINWQTVTRLNMLRSLVTDPGPASGRLPGSPGEAVSRFRDDSRNVALVLDVWLDMCGAAVSTTLALVVMATVDWRVTLVVAVPVAAALLLTRGMASRLKELRLVEREATAAVTGFIGDTFGAVTAIKAAGAEVAVERRFSSLGDARAAAALRDQVAQQVLQTVSGATGNLSTGLALLLLAPALAAGDATVGDIGLFAASAIVIANLPRWVTRLGIHTRQGDVSVDRMGRLLPPGADPLRIAEPVPTTLRTGPGDFPAVPVPDRGSRGPDGLRQLQVSGLVVNHPGGTGGVGPVDLALQAGTVTVITGPVGSGKSTLLRALLGLVAIAEGEIRWNGEVVTDPSVAMTPPRVAYLPQVPRLFSESLAETVLLGVADEGLAEALRIACLDDDVAGMTEGLATRVGPKGVRLSGGQIQRTAAARAFVRRPDLLLVDDLSSALDVRTETMVWDRLLDREDRPTLLVVSHRQRVLAEADQVIHLTPRGGRPLSDSGGAGDRLSGAAGDRGRQPG
ncbi:ABC transporter ATP-binding protein [soil metagenome]